MRPRLSTTIASIALTIAVLMAAGCGGSAVSATGTHLLDGTAWHLTGWTLSSLDPNAYTITAVFAGGKVSGDAGVNAYGGPYTAGPDQSFSVGKLAVTAEGGIGAVMRAEDAYLTLLGEAKSFKRSGGRLTLFDRRGNTSLIFQATKR
jgi:heat shock protein HslJ